MKTEIIYLPKAVSDQANIKNIYLNFIPVQAKDFLHYSKRKSPDLKRIPTHALYMKMILIIVCLW